MISYFQQLKDLIMMITANTGTMMMMMMDDDDDDDDLYSELD